MSNQFQIIEVPEDAAEAQEAMGSRFKFWFHHQDLGNCLFKQVRSNTGEDWSEKVASELAELLGLPHAIYELATWRDRRGVISPNFIKKDTSLDHGNDILAGLVSGYPQNQTYGVSQHTLNIVISALQIPGSKLPLNWNPPTGINDALSTFVGYLLLDAWIGNGDRHHENWGFVVTRQKNKHLAPTYDHASSLGRELTDARRQKFLESQMVNRYVKKSRSAFYDQAGDRKTIPTFEVFQAIANKSPQSAKIWLDQLSKVSVEAVKSIFDRVPEHLISPTAIEFSLAVLDINQRRLLDLQDF